MKYVEALWGVHVLFVNPVFFVSLLSTEELRKLSWSGIPKPVRPITWKLLSVSLFGPARERGLAPSVARQPWPGQLRGPARERGPAPGVARQPCPGRRPVFAAVIRAFA